MISCIAPGQNPSAFYPADLLNAAQKTEALFLHPDQVDISLYPDAMFKANGTPNGLLIRSAPEDTLLIPTLLRDPGCGFACFRLSMHTSPDKGWSHQVGQALDQAINYSERGLGALRSLLKMRHLTLNNILVHGLEALDLPNAEKARFSHLCFDVDEQWIQYDQKTQRILEDDLGHLTNTVEIRRVSEVRDSCVLGAYEMSQDDYVGFVHSGCHAFPKILAEQFLQPIYEYAYVHGIAIVELIQQGVFGVPLNTDLGRRYYAWLKAAMNYALVSRYALYRRVANCLSGWLPDCAVQLISDRVHAGVWEEILDQKTVICSSRGVQSIVPQQYPDHPPIGLLAGERETAAALVSIAASESTNTQYFSHGIHGRVSPDFCAGDFDQSVRDSIELVARQAYYNSTPNFSDCLPMTYNLQQALSCFESMNIVTPVALLEPVINIFGHPLQRAYAHSTH